jgi:inorganic pyrophosphatase
MVLENSDLNILERSMKAIIEMPRGDTRRRHLKYDKSGFVDLSPIKDVIPANDGVMPVHYGYIPDTFNPKDDDEVDILVLSDKDFKVGEKTEVKVIALIKRADGDNKVVAVDETQPTIQKWSDVDGDTRSIIETFFSYHHPILSIEDADVAERYVLSNSLNA